MKINYTCIKALPDAFPSKWQGGKYWCNLSLSFSLPLSSPPAQWQISPQFWSDTGAPHFVLGGNTSAVLLTFWHILTQSAFSPRVGDYSCWIQTICQLLKPTYRGLKKTLSECFWAWTWNDCFTNKVGSRSDFGINWICVSSVKWYRFSFLLITS